jgi:hypothetical protein
MGGWHLGNAPADFPLTYPGANPPADALLSGTSLYPLVHPGPDGAGLGTWRVGRPGTAPPLDDALADAGATPAAGRTAVLAVGSNACAAQLARKLADMPPQNRVVPMVRVRADGVAAGHSAHVGRFGYVPRTPIARHGYHLHWLILLDAAQVAAIDATEANYTVVKGASPLVMYRDPALRVPEWVMYRTRWGALAYGGQTVPMLAMPQEDMFGYLLRQPWFSVLMPGGAETAVRTVGLLARFEPLRDQVREAMAAHAVNDGLQDAVPVR